MQAKKLVPMRFYNDGLFDNSKGTMTIILTQLQLNGSGNDGQYTQITNGTTVLATATDGSVRQIHLRCFWFLLVLQPMVEKAAIVR
jgi:hypothetical protein